jgi:hypothetical protein
MKILTFLLAVMVPALANNWTTTSGTTYHDIKVIKIEADYVTVQDADGGAMIEIAKLPPDIQKTLTQEQQQTSANTPQVEKDWVVGGKEYHNVVVGQIEADQVHITYDGGIGSVALADLSPDLQKHFGYDPGQAKEASEARNQAQAEATQEMQKQAQQQKEQELADKNKPLMRLIGTVENTSDEGCIVNVTYDADMRQAVASQDYGSWRAVGGGGSSPYDAANGVVPSNDRGFSSGGRHYSMDSLVKNMESSFQPPSSPKPPAPQLPVVPDGLYFLSGTQGAVGEKIDALVHLEAPTKYDDGQTYQCAVSQ